MYSDDTVKRFWKKVAIGGPDDCWEWTGSKYPKPKNYGRMNVGGKILKPHRMAWEIVNQQNIPAGQCVCHSCDNPPCVNPAHLWLGSYAKNNQDRHEKGRSYIWRRAEHPRAKLTEADVIEIRRRYSNGESGYKIAQTYQMNPAHIYRIIRGISWREK